MLSKIAKILIKIWTKTSQNKKNSKVNKVSTIAIFVSRTLSRFF